MATYSTDLSVFDAADAATNWSELSGHTSGGAPAADTENYFQNSIAVSQSTGQATTTDAGMECDYGSAITWTDGWVIMAWLYYGAPTNLNTWTNGGYRMGVGSSSGNMYFWKASGSDFGDLPKAAWQNVAIDPNDPSGTTNAHLAADYTDGTPTSSKQLYGTLPNVLAKITKGNPHANDIIRYGRGEIYATGTGGTFSGYATANDAATAKWGLFESIRGGYLWKGLFSFGQSATSLTFTDSNITIFLDDTPRVQSDFNKMQTLNASTSVTWTGINIIGLATSVTGSAPIPNGVFDFSTGTISITGGRFENLGDWTFSSSDSIDGATFDNCGQITHGGADFDACIFKGYEGTAGTAYMTYAVAVDPNGELDDCSFTKGTASTHAIEFDATNTPTTITLTGIDFSGYNASNGQNDSTLYFPSTSKSYTVNLVDCTGNVTYRVGTGGSVTISSSVDITITVKDDVTKAVIENAQVSMHYESVVGEGYDTQIMNEDTLSTGVATEAFSGTVPVTALLKIRKSDDTDDPRYLGFSDIVTVSTTGYSRTVYLKRNDKI